MDDEFWKTVLSLTNYGEFQFLESHTSSSDCAVTINKALGQYKSGNIFHMIKNYILLEEFGGSVNFGSLEISWSLSSEIDDLVEKMTMAFSILHKVNYLLYRKHYINNK